MSAGASHWSGHWRPVQAFVPPRLRVDPANPPKEEWLPVGDALLHLDRYLPDRPAAARVIVLHGGGTHGGFLAPFGVMVQRQGYEAVLPDLPGYGRTQVVDRRGLRYSDWAETATALVGHETANDPRPLVLLGLSMGGMLAYDVAGRRGDIAAVVASCLLDPSRPEVRQQISRTP
ncbi:hypothetical protein GCM10029963_21380 [Micromonospora andamanensis]|uniref:alpha/beta hydrolase n=1 Tax=Micromonospora andamanensis TaxID=1287068 RepID=UPI001A4BC425|nr:hypothetical protein Vwe01_34460 [Micromonospora andamanensis]